MTPQERADILKTAFDRARIIADQYMAGRIAEAMGFLEGAKLLGPYQTLVLTATCREMKRRGGLVMLAAFLDAADAEVLHAWERPQEPLSRFVAGGAREVPPTTTAAVAPIARPVAAPSGAVVPFPSSGAPQWPAAGPGPAYLGKPHDRPISE